MSESARNIIEIRCTPEQLYAYVTQPWLWHEWHPNSKSAHAAVSALQVGDGFDEVIEIQPLAPLPLRLKRATRYKVLAAEPGTLWKVEGKMKDGWLQIQYEFKPTPSGTQFTRTLTYGVTGLNRLMLPLPLLRRRMAAISLVALSNLKKRLEAAA
ncbi:MAG: SRPBCC family protein [Pseudomonadota bacterium]|nr:SRPBCC family protein [Pseudomonadota bacterium]